MGSWVDVVVGGSWGLPRGGKREQRNSKKEPKWMVNYPKGTQKDANMETEFDQNQPWEPMGAKGDKKGAKRVPTGTLLCFFQAARVTREGKM